MSNTWWVSDGGAWQRSWGLPATASQGQAMHAIPALPMLAAGSQVAAAAESAPVAAIPFRPAGQRVPLPMPGQPRKSHNSINDFCLAYEAKTLKEKENVTFDGACRYIVNKSGIQMDVLLAETVKHPALNALLRKEQALKMYLLAYKKVHSVWSVEDMRQQFPCSSFCRKEGLPGTWDSLRLGEFCAHPVFREIFPELSEAVDLCRSTALDAMEALQMYRFSVGVKSRVELQEFVKWYEAKHGNAFARDGIFFPEDRLPLVLSAQNNAFKHFGEATRAARARFMTNVADCGEQAVQKSITEWEDWSHVNQQQIQCFLERWQGVANVSFSRAVAEICLWIQHMLDAELDPVIQLLCAAFVRAIQKDAVAHMDEMLPSLRSPSEVIRLVQMELANCQHVSLDWLLTVEQKIVGHHQCFEEALGQSQKMSFLQFLHDTSTLADTINADMNAQRTACTSRSNPSRATVVDATLASLKHHCDKTKMSMPILDVYTLLAVESRVRRQLQIVGDKFASWKSFVHFLSEANEIHEAGWCPQASQYDPLEHWVRHLSAIDKLGGELASAQFRVVPGTLCPCGERQGTSVDGFYWEAEFVQLHNRKCDIESEEDTDELEQLMETELGPVPSIGLLGEVTETMAISALLHAPLLKNVAESILWSHVFEPSLGNLQCFLEHISKRDGLSNHGLAFIIPSKHLADTSLAPIFFRIPCHTSYDELKASVRSCCATTVAAHLCALTCESKSSMELHAFHFSQAAAELSVDNLMELCVSVLTRLPERLAQGVVGHDVILPVMRRVQAYADMALITAERVEGAVLRLGLLGTSWKILPWSLELQRSLSSGFKQAGAVTEEGAAAKGLDASINLSLQKAASSICDDNESSDDDDLMPPMHPEHVQPQDCKLIDGDHAPVHAGICEGSTIKRISSPEDVVDAIYGGFMLDSSEASALQESLGGALQRLSDDLYRDRHHHIFELLQNFADNTYPRGVRRLVKFELDSCQLVALNNEVGFNEANVRALCAVNMSTKQSSTEHGTSGMKIGCKGIGFKSVFKITDTPILHSGPWHFHFDASLKNKASASKLKGLGFIVPHPLPSSDKQNPEWTTEIRLPFKTALSQRDRADIAEDIANLNGEVLLFIPIDSIETCDANGKEHIVQKESVCENFMRIWTQTGMNRTYADYLLQRHSAPAAGEGVIELVLAVPFPATDISSSGLWLQSCEPEKFTYCSLPLSNYGWRVLISANFDVTASRDQIHDSAWNQQIRKELPTLFVKLFRKARDAGFIPSDLQAGGDAFDFNVGSILAEPKVRCLPHCFLFRFIPKPGELGQGASAFFRGCEAKIWEAFRNERCIMSADEEWHLPGKTFLAPESMVRYVPSSLLLEAAGLHYVHRQCVPPSDAVLKLLGMKHKDDTLAILLKVWNWVLDTDHALVNDYSWVASILDLIYTILFEGPLAFCEERLKQLRGIRLVPVANAHGSLQVVVPSSNVFLPGREASNIYCSRVIEAFQIHLVSSSVLQHGQQIENLLVQLGVVELSATSLISSVLLPFFEYIPTAATDPIFITKASASICYLAQVSNQLLQESIWHADKTTSLCDLIHIPCMSNLADCQVTLVHASGAIFSPPYHNISNSTGISRDAHAILADEAWPELMESVWLVDPGLIKEAQDLTSLYMFLHSCGVRSFCSIESCKSHCCGKDLEALEPWSQLNGFQWPEQLIATQEVEIQDFVPGAWLPSFLTSIGKHSMPSSISNIAFRFVAAGCVLDFSEMLRASACSTPIPSSLFCALKSIAWVPHPSGKVCPPSDLLLDFPIEFKFGRGKTLQRKTFRVSASECLPTDIQCRFVPREVTKNSVAQFLFDVLEVRPCGARDVLGVLQHWSLQSLTTTSEAELTRMYVFLHTRPKLEDQLEIKTCFQECSKPLIFVPDALHETKVMPEDKIIDGKASGTRQGQWFTIHQCCVREWRGLRNDTRPRKQDRLLSKFGVKELEVHYGRILSDPFEGFGVKYDTNMEMLLDACSNAARATCLEFVEEVFAFYNQRLGKDDVEELRILLSHYPVILTSSNVWVKWKLAALNDQEDVDRECVEVFLPAPGGFTNKDIAVVHARFCRFKDLFVKLGMKALTRAACNNPAPADATPERASIDVHGILQQSNEVQTLCTLFAYMQIWLHEKGQLKLVYAAAERSMGVGANVVAAKGINLQNQVLMTKWDAECRCLYIKLDESSHSPDVLSAALEELLSAALSKPLPALASCLHEVLNGMLTNITYPGLAAEQAMKKHGISRPWPDLQWWFGAAPLPTEVIHRDEANYSKPSEAADSSSVPASTHQFGCPRAVSTAPLIGQRIGDRQFDVGGQDHSENSSWAAPEVDVDSIATCKHGKKKQQSTFGIPENAQPPLQIVPGNSDDSAAVLGDEDGSPAAPVAADKSGKLELAGRLDSEGSEAQKQVRRLNKKLREINGLVKSEEEGRTLSADQSAKVSRRVEVMAELIDAYSSAFQHATHEGPHNQGMPNPGVSISRNTNSYDCGKFGCMQSSSLCPQATNQLNWNGERFETQEASGASSSAAVDVSHAPTSATGFETWSGAGFVNDGIQHVSFGASRNPLGLPGQKHAGSTECHSAAFSVDQQRSSLQACGSQEQKNRTKSMSLHETAMQHTNVNAVVANFRCSENSFENIGEVCANADSSTEASKGRTNGKHDHGKIKTSSATPDIQCRPKDLTQVHSQTHEKYVKVYDWKRCRYVPGKVVENQESGCQVELLLDDVATHPVQWYPTAAILPISSENDPKIAGQDQTQDNPNLEQSASAPQVCTPTPSTHTNTTDATSKGAARPRTFAEIVKSSLQSDCKESTRAGVTNDHPAPNHLTGFQLAEQTMVDDSNELRLQFDVVFNLFSKLLQELQGAQPKLANKSQSMEHAVKSLHSTGAQLFRVLVQIYVENGGPALMARQHQRQLTVTEIVLPVDDVWFTHSEISPTFSSVPHRGEPIRNLLENLQSGANDLADFILIAVRYEGRVHSLNNRRLWVAKEFQRRSKTVQKIRVLVYDLCPVTAKFIMAYTSDDNGQTVKIRGL